MQTTLAKALAKRAEALKENCAKVARGEKVYTHIPTGLSTFDDQFGGLEIGILTTVVGHTGDGKTAFLMQLAKGAAQAGFGVLFFLLEDPVDRVADRELAAVMGESANKLARLQVKGLAVDGRIDAAVQSMDWAKRVGLNIGQVTASEILETVIKTTHVGGAPVGLVIVDYAQGLPEGDVGMEKMCAETAQALNMVAMERNIATVFGSQVKTEVLERGRLRWERSLQKNGTPQMADEGGFRPGKGDIAWARRMEQYSKAVWYLFRPGRWRKELGDPTAKDNRLLVWVGKANFSSEGGAEFIWEGQSCTITDKVREKAA